MSARQGILFSVLVGIALCGALGVAVAAPVQWAGNGHWYEAVAVEDPYGISWQDAQAAAINQGGYLATITSAAENDFVFSLIDDTTYWNSGWLTNPVTDYMGPWIGAYQDDSQHADPLLGWHWVTGEAWEYTNWGLRGGVQEPNGDAGAVDSHYIQYYSGPTDGRSPYWNDCPDYTPVYYRGQTNPQAYVMEWDNNPSISYQWLGFLPPLTANGNGLFKRRSTIPVKFRIADLDGNAVPDCVAMIEVFYYGSSGGEGSPQVISSSNGDTGDTFRYSPTGDLYIFNLSTRPWEYLGNMCYQVVVMLDDGQQFDTYFTLR